ncbi:hypothetical protein SAMN02990966_06831 [Rhodospirillales bacterium URHD0017]|nr:hypothetical protein SAMN02990966_06831 [Rhodospirillales bacterium URHD0017]
MCYSYRMSEDLRATVRAIKGAGFSTLGAIAKALQDRGIKTPAGSATWHRAQVSRLLDATPTPERAPTVAMVRVVITANHVPLPVEDDDTVRPGWQRATRTKRVYVGRRLSVPEDLAELLAFRRQAVALSP